MGTQRGAATEDVATLIEHELETVRSAVSMVASGGAPRVWVAGLRFGDQLVEPARRMAEAAGVRVYPEWSADESGAAIVVERIDPAERDRA